jgi:hypothetical protein
MKILLAVKSAAFRSLRSWKGILIVWFSSLLLVSMLALPMKGALNSGFGKSMITEKLTDGINIEVFADLGAAFKSLASYFSAGLIIILLTGFLINTFLTGGLFYFLRGSSAKFSAAEFFQASAKFFWSFLVILLIISIIAILIFVLTVVLPVSLVSQAEIPEDGAIFKACIIGFSLFFVLLAILLLVADYARAWQVSEEKNACFRAIGYGFSQTFRTFLSSYPLIIIFMVLQFLYLWFVMKIIPGMKPATGLGVFALLLLSQFLFCIKILFKVWRYGSVTSLKEINTEKVSIAL